MLIMGLGTPGSVWEQHAAEMLTPPDAGEWAAMGGGIIDVKGVVAYLRDTGFDGWVMVEDECPRAEVEPGACTLHNGEFIRL